MNNLSDLLQISLTLPWPVNALVVLIILLLTAQTLKVARKVVGLGFAGVRLIWSIRLRLSIGRAVLYCCASLAVCALSDEISDYIQYLEQTTFHPAYVAIYTDPVAGDAYEAEISRHLGPNEADIFRRRVAQIAGKYGSNVLALYEVGFSECGLNPFAFNRNRITGDTAAAGLIQFTAKGLQDVRLDGGRVTMRMVKDWCLNRNLDKIMDCTDAYFSAVCGSRPMPTALDVYLAVFAPGKIGAARGEVLYAYQSNWAQAYLQNIGFDGYFVERLGEREVIRHSVRARDGRITVEDVRLHLEMKKSLLLSAYLKSR